MTDTSRTPEEIVRLVEADRYEEALGIPPKATVSQIQQAVMLLSKRHPGKEVRAAIAKAGNHLKEEAVDPEAALARLRKQGQALGRSTDLAVKRSALPLLEELVRQAGEPIDLHWLGSVLVQLSRAEEGLPHLLRAAEERSESIDFCWLGEAYLLLNRFPPAVDAFRKAATAGGSADDFAQLGRALYQTGKIEEAIATLRKAAQTPGNDTEYQILGAVLWQTGRHDDALTLLRGTAGQKKHDFEGVMKEARSGWRLLDRKSHHLVAQARGAANRKEWKTGIRCLRDAVRRFRRYPPAAIREELANLYNKRGVANANRAVDILKSAQSRDIDRAIHARLI